MHTSDSLLVAKAERYPQEGKQIRALNESVTRKVFAGSLASQTNANENENIHEHNPFP